MQQTLPVCVMVYLIHCYETANSPRLSIGSTGSGQPSNVFKVGHKTVDDEVWMEEESKELNAVFNQRCMDAVQKCIRSSLEQLKKAIFPQS